MRKHLISSDKIEVERRRKKNRNRKPDNNNKKGYNPYFSFRYLISMGRKPRCTTRYFKHTDSSYIKILNPRLLRRGRHKRIKKKKKKIDI